MGTAVRVLTLGLALANGAKSAMLPVACPM